MIGAGTFINPLLKIVTTVAILAAVYLFIVKPILDTTENAIDRSFDSFQGFQEPFNDLPAQIQNAVDQARQDADTQRQVNRLQRCIENALPNQNRVQRCVAKHSP